MPEAEPLSPRKTAVVLLIVGGCFAVLWPRLLQPALLGKSQHDPIAPNNADRAQGCCDVIFETDVDAIKIMIELCSNILERKSGPLDVRTSSAFAAGKLPPDIIRTCRLEVNATCGVDISTFLQQNVKLGKTYKQILDEVRSYNSSACLKMHYGVPTWALGSGHVVVKSLTQQQIESVKQERPPYGRGVPHPAMLERGRAIPAPDRVVPRAPDVIQRAEGRVRSPLSVYYQDEPPPVPGVRPPLGGAGGAVPPQKTSVGLVMPMYTLCIVVFFVYTLCKILFKRTDSQTGGNYENVTPDPLFRRRVFEDRRSSRQSPDTKLVVSAISGLVAEVQQQMEASYANCRVANGAQVIQPENGVPHTNGTLHKPERDASTVRIVAKEFKQVSPVPEESESKEMFSTLDQSFESKDKLEVKENKTETREVADFVSDYEEKTTFDKADDIVSDCKEYASEFKAQTPELIEETLDHKQNTAELLTELKREEQENNDLQEHKFTLETPFDADKDTVLNAKTDDAKEAIDEHRSPFNADKDAVFDAKEEKDEDIHEALSEEEIEYEVEEDEEESPIVRQLRASVEKDKATVKHEAAEVSSIFLPGEIPQQSRVLVADSHTDASPTGKDSPVVLSGKMTLSLINDDAKSTPDRDLESPTTLDDEDFTTASAYTQPKQNSQQEAELSEEEIEEEVEEEEVEIEEIEEEEENVKPATSVSNT